MSLSKFASLIAAAVVLSAATAHAGDHPRAGGVWRPAVENADYSDRTVLILGSSGRFAALVERHPASETALPEADRLAAASGSWALYEDGGELGLTFDNPAAQAAPGTTLYLQMLLLGDELQPYPGLEGRSPIAATAWRRSEDTSDRQASGISR